MGTDSPQHTAEGGARPPRPGFVNPRRRTLRHDNTYSGSGSTSSTRGSTGGSTSVRGRLHHEQHTTFDDNKYSSIVNKFLSSESAGLTNGPGPHIKGVHSYIFGDNSGKKDYGSLNNHGSFSSYKSPASKKYSDLDDLDFDLDFGKSKGHSCYSSRPPSRASAVDSSYADPSWYGRYVSPLDVAAAGRRTSPATTARSRPEPVPTSPVLPRRSAPVYSAPPSTLFRRSPSPVRRTQVGSTYTPAYRRSPSPVSYRPTTVYTGAPPSLYRRSPSPTSYRSSASLGSAYRGTSASSATYRGTSPSPVRPTYVAPVASSPLITQRRASFAYPSATAATSTRRGSFSYPSPQRRSSFSYPSGAGTGRRSSVINVTSPAPPPPPAPSAVPQRYKTHIRHYPTPVDINLRRHSVAAPSHYTPHVRRATSGATTVTESSSSAQHGPVHSRRFPERYTLVKSTLRTPGRADIERDIPIESEVPFVSQTPRHLGRRYSLDAGLARMGVESLGTMDVYREQTVSSTRAARSMTRPPRPRPMHPPITRPDRPEGGKQPLYDVDLYWITRQQLLEQPDITSKFQPLKNRLNQMGVHTLPPNTFSDPPAPDPGRQVYVSPVSRPGEIPHFNRDFQPYDPLHHTRKVRPGGPLYIHSVGEDPRSLSHSELEPYRKDGVVCVMVVRGSTGGGGGTHSYHHVSSSGGGLGGLSGGISAAHSLPLSAHSLGVSSSSSSLGLGSGGLGGLGGASGLGLSGRSAAGAGVGYGSPSYHRIPDFLDLAEPYDTSAPHVRPYVPLGGGRGGGGGAGAGAGGYRPGGAGLGGGIPSYIPAPAYTPSTYSPAPSYSPTPSYGGGYPSGGGGYPSGGGGGYGGGGSPYDSYSPSRGAPRGSRASSVPVGDSLPPAERFKGTPRSWEPAKAREVPAGNFTASRPPRHVEPPVSDVRRRAREVICKTRNDPRYYDL